MKTISRVVRRIPAPVPPAPVPVERPRGVAPAPLRGFPGALVLAELRDQGTIQIVPRRRPRPAVVLGELTRARGFVSVLVPERREPTVAERCEGIGLLYATRHPGSGTAVTL